MFRRSIIVAGSRSIDDIDNVRKACIASGFFQTDGEIEIVSGGARGVDKLGEQVAKENGYLLKVFPADWKTFGRRAGPLRNIQMGEYADYLVAIRLNKSRGTTHMIEYMGTLKKPVYVVDISTEN